MSSRVFYGIYFTLHLAVAAGAYVLWTRYGLFAALFAVIAGVVALQAWLVERRKATRRGSRRRR